MDLLHEYYKIVQPLLQPEEKVEPVRFDFVEVITYGVVNRNGVVYPPPVRLERGLTVHERTLPPVINPRAIANARTISFIRREEA